MAFAAAPLLHAADSGNLELTVNGLQNDRGTVRVALFNAGDAYTKATENEGTFQGPALAIKNGVARHLFSGIPYGDYALSPPEYPKAKFTLDAASKAIEIKAYK